MPIEDRGGWRIKTNKRKIYKTCFQKLEMEYHEFYNIISHELKKEVSNPILQMEIDRSIRDIYNRLETDELKECCVKTIGKAYHTIFITGLREARPVLTR